MLLCQIACGDMNQKEVDWVEVMENGVRRRGRKYTCSDLEKMKMR
jgi:hypothetical protein